MVERVTVSDCKLSLVPSSGCKLFQPSNWPDGYAPVIASWQTAILLRASR